MKKHIAIIYDNELKKSFLKSLLEECGSWNVKMQKNVLENEDTVIDFLRATPEAVCGISPDVIVLCQLVNYQELTDFLPLYRTKTITL